MDYSSTFNTIVPYRLDGKLWDLGLNTSLCDWILDFLTDRPQTVRVAGQTSSTLCLSQPRSTTGLCPQPSPVSPLLPRLQGDTDIKPHGEVR